MANGKNIRRNGKPLVQRHQLSFNLRPSRSKGIVFVEACFTSGYERYRFSLRRKGEPADCYLLTPTEWETRRTRAIGRNARTINQRVDEVNRLIDEYIQLCTETEQKPSASDVKKLWKGELDPKDLEGGFVRLVERFLSEYSFRNKQNVKCQLRSNSRAQYGTLLNNLRAFEDHRSIGSPCRLPLRLPEFAQVSRFTTEEEPRVLTEFRDFLVEVRNNRPSTIAKATKCLATILRWAEDRGFSGSLLLYKSTSACKFAGGDHPTLQVDEIADIKSLQLKPGSVRWHVQQTFLLMCATAQRYSDLHKIDPNLWKERGQTIVQVKTGSPAIIIHNDEVRAILQQYGNTEWPAVILPSKTGKMTKNSKFNLTLKSLCQEAGLNRAIPTTRYEKGTPIIEDVPLWQRISTHTGRRTFITQNLTSGATQTVVALQTGHTDMKQLRPGGPYLKKDLHSLADELNIKRIE